MSSNCPPQLQLSLQSSTTSFKRSFEQFGFDLESPRDATDAGGSGANNGNDRNKRARSASSFSEGSDSMDSSHLSSTPSGSSGSSPSRHGADAAANDSTPSPIVALGASLSTHGALEPPRLPTPDIHDIEMPDYPADGHNSESFADSLAPQVPDQEDRYHYNHFHNAISSLRHPPSTSSLVSRSPTAPPVLPPLYISQDQTRLSTSPIPFLHPSPSTTSHADSYFNNESPSSIPAQSPTTNHDNSLYEEQEQDHQHDSLFQNDFLPTRDPLAFSLPSSRLSNNTSGSRSERQAVPSTRHPLSASNPTHFRDHLNSALDLLRSSSPLVPGLEDVGEEPSPPPSHVNNRIPRALPNPPTLPSIVTHTDHDTWNQNSPSDIFTHVPSASSFASPATNFESSIASSNNNLDLRDLPLPSPGLHDLHSWMDASSSGSSHSWDTSQISASSVTPDSRQDSSNVTTFQGTFATSSTGQSRSERGYTASIPQQPTSSSPTVLSSPLRHRRFMRMSDLEGNRREWPSTSMSISTSTSLSQSDSDSPLNSNPSPIGLPPLPFNRRSADEVAVRSLDQGFDSRLRLSFAARSSSYLDRFRVHESHLAESAADRGRRRASNTNLSELLGQMADESDARERGDRGLTSSQRNITSRPTLLAGTLERRRTSRENPSGFLGRTLNELDAGDNGSAGPPPLLQATLASRYLDPDSQLVNSSNFAESRTGFNNNNHMRDLYLRHRLRAQMTRPGASNSLVNESAAEARRQADRLEILEGMNDGGGQDRRNDGGSGTIGDSFDSQLRSLEADLRENGMSSVGWNPASLNRRPPLGPTNDSEASEDSQRNHIPWRHPPTMNRSHYLSSLHQQRSILPLPGLSSNDDMDMMIGESIGFRPTEFTTGSASSNDNTRNNQILPSSLYENPFSSRTASRPSNYFWLNSSRPASADPNSMDTGVSPELPSPASETDIFDSRFTTVSDMVNPLTGASLSTGGDQRRHSASSDSSHSDGVHGTRSSQPYLNDPPSLPSPDLGGVFDAERHASSIAISDESPETIFVHPPRRPLRETSGISLTNPLSIDRSHPSIPIQDDANSSTTNNPNIRISYTDARQHQAPELEALMQRQRRSQLEARRISARAEEIRGMVGSLSNNPVANPTNNTQAQSALDLHRSSTLGRGYRNTPIEPPERRSYTRTVPSTTSDPPSRYQSLDPSSFTPGPFRNTVQQLFNERRHSLRRPDPPPSVAPTIPPLSFEENDLSNSLHQRNLFQQLRRIETTQATSTSTRDAADDRLRRERAIAEEGLRREQQQVINRRITDRLAAARGLNESNRRRETSDMHRYLMQQARMDGSRLEDPESPASSHGLRHAIDALRPDDSNILRSQQIIDRFHRERDSSRSRVEPESAPVITSTIPAGPRRPDGRRFLRESMMRRESGLGDEERRSAAIAQHQEEQRESEELAALGLSQSLSQSMRGRRGRLPRVSAEVMYSLGRHARRVGAFGDYVRDEDFDESYEGLLSLSATLGDVKPKSTPASILSELETGQYKDWATPESDQRCPICLDDYQPTDQVLKLNNCSHWLHKDCLQQWLQGARTCPVCRKSVYPTSQASSSPSSRRPHPRHPHMHYPVFGGSSSSWRRDHPPSGGGVDPV